MLINYHKIIRPVRLLIALAAAIFFSQLIGIEMSGWVIITTTVVLFDQVTVGGTINRSLLRFAATFFGGLISLICIIFFKNNQVLIWSVLAGATFIYAYIFMDSKKSYIGILGIATMAILLIGTSTPDLHSVFFRIMDIMLGIFFAVISMLIIFPEYALNKSRTLIYAALGDIAALIRASLNQTNIELIRQEILKVETKFTGEVVNFNKTLDEAKYELRGKRNPQLIQNYAKSFLQVRRLYRLIIVIFYYELENDIVEDKLVQQILAQLLGLMDKLSQTKPNYNYLTQHFQAIEALIRKLPSPTLCKTCLHFINELQTLNILLQKT